MSPNLRVCIDPRVELLSIIFRLAGSYVCSDPGIDSYDKDVATAFSDYTSHPAVSLAVKLHEKFVQYSPGESFLMLAIHLSDVSQIRLRPSLDPFPRGLRPRWQIDDIRRFIPLVKDFVNKSSFVDFMASHQDDFAKVTERMEEAFAQYLHFEWLEQFFGAKLEGSSSVIIAMLIGDRNYGNIAFESAAKRETYAILSPGRASDCHAVRFGRYAARIAIHEFGHSHVNPMVATHAKVFRPVSEKLFSKVADKMTRISYGSWQAMIHESLIRASELRYRLRYEGEESVAEAIADDTKKGFAWIEPLYILLGEYEANRNEFPTLEEFIPRIIRFLDNY